MAEEDLHESISTIFEGALSEFRSIAERFYQIALVSSDAAVRRNGAIAEAREAPHEKAVGLLHQVLFSNIKHDADMASRMKESVLGLDAAVEKVSDIETIMLGYISQLSADRADALFDLNQVRRAKAPEDRLRVHGLNDPDVRDAVWNITGGKCWYCDGQLVRGGDITDETQSNFCIDHLVAKANGGPDHLSNYVPACRRCNSSKCAKSYVEFKRWRAERANLTVIEGDCAPENGEAA